MRYIVGSVLVLLLIVFACKKDDGKVVATYKGGKITMKELDLGINSMPPNLKARYATPEGKKLFLEQMIDKKLILKKAEDEKLDQDPQMLQQIDEYRANLLRNRILQEITSKKVEITDADVKNYYETHPEEFNQPEKVCFNRIQNKDRKQVEAALKKLRSKKIAFIEAVKEYSDDPVTKMRGGDLGCVAKGQRPDLPEEVFSLAQDAISNVLSVMGHYQIIHVKGRVPAQKVNLESSSQGIRQRIINVKRRESYENFLKELKASSDIKIYSEALGLEEKTPENK